MFEANRKFRRQCAKNGGHRWLPFGCSFSDVEDGEAFCYAHRDYCGEAPQPPDAVCGDCGQRGASA